jgi:inosine-uridine nucleoside N-ribohydrolase
MRVHIDTDFGGDPDDACALAMLLGWPDVEIVGITTNLEVDGRRAAGVSHYLGLAGRTDVPVAAGAEHTLTSLSQYEPVWGEPTVSSPAGAALDLLQHSIEDDAVIVAIGAFTNLALLEVMRRDALRGVPVVAMAGWLEPAGPGFPDWGPAMDFNVQCDTRAAQIVVGVADLTLVPLTVAMRAQLRAAQLQRLAAFGPIGELLARQSETHASKNDMSRLARAHAALPDDLVNFHWDPVAAAVAVGWPGVTLEERSLAPELLDDVLVFRPTDHGTVARVAVNIDAPAFEEVWLRKIEVVDREARSRVTRARS